MIIKYLFYIALLLFLYRTLFRPKVIIEHRHIHDKKPNDATPKKKLGDFTEYEEIKE